MNINRKNRILASTREAYRDSLRKNLQHRLEVARNKGDEKLIEQLKKELEIYISTGKSYNSIRDTYYERSSILK